MLRGCVVVVLPSNANSVGALGPSTQIAKFPAAAQATFKSLAYLPTSTEQGSAATVVAPAGATTARLKAFTARQRDVLRLIVQGMSNKEIARALNLGEGTVKVHMAAIFRKLGVNRRVAVAVVAAQLLTEIAA